MLGARQPPASTRRSFVSVPLRRKKVVFGFPFWLGASWQGLQRVLDNLREWAAPGPACSQSYAGSTTLLLAVRSATFKGAWTPRIWLPFGPWLRPQRHHTASASRPFAGTAQPLQHPRRRDTRAAPRSSFIGSWRS